MILKIKRHESNQDWWMLDNIRKISVSETFLSEISEYNKISETSDILIMDHTNEVNNDHISYKNMIIKDKDDREYDIMFDTVAYLCNDDGKTIEKIVVNY